MKTHNWNTIGLYAGGHRRADLLALHTWHEAATPQFVGGVIIGLVAVVKAIYQSGPNDPPTV
jgi:hypothetical protein